MKKVNLLTLFAITLFLFTSCAQELDDALNNKENQKEVKVKMSLSVLPMESITYGDNISNSPTTRSTVNSEVDEDAVVNMWVVQFDNTGIFLKKEYFASVDKNAVDVPLIANSNGRTSNVYIITNIGNEMPYVDSETQFKTMGKKFTQESQLFETNGAGKKCIPMVGKLSEIAVPKTGYIDMQNVTLKRMLAKVVFTYNVNTTIGIEEIRVRNVSTQLSFSPITDSELSTGEVQDLAIEAAPSLTNGTMTFYLPNNQRGTSANASNERYKIGVPNSTYIELKGHIVGQRGGEKLTYSSYIGANNFNDYNLKSNSQYSITTNIGGQSITDPRVKVSERTNCFVLSSNQETEIPVNKVNVVGLGVQLPDTRTGWTASVLWQTAAGLVSVDNSTADKGYFKVKASSTIAKGNAVVVVRKGTKILWSWHIWVTPIDFEKPENQTKDTEGGLYTWMRCNLGAVGSTILSPNLDNAGLFYQWGRKDPFIGSSTVSPTHAAYPLYDKDGNKYVPDAVTELTTTTVAGNDYIRLYPLQAVPPSGTDALVYSVKYPSLFISQWGGTTCENFLDYRSGSDSWGGEYQQLKSEYDPCPAGWRVPSRNRTAAPISEIWSTVSTINLVDANTDGQHIKQPSGDVYPCGGQIKDGIYDEVGGAVNVFSASAAMEAGAQRATTFIGGFSSLFYLGSVYYLKYYGCNVRCVKNWN